MRYIADLRGKGEHDRGYVVLTQTGLLFRV